MFATELLKVPSLVQHYIDHSGNRNPEESFLSFLWEHYIKNDASDEATGHCHGNLPFKQCDDCYHHVIHIVPFLIPQNFRFEIVDIFSKKELFTCYKGFFSTYYGQIWQPPKIG